MTDRHRIAMAYQACEVADLARSAVTLDNAADAVPQAELVLAAAQQLLAAATRLAQEHPHAPSDPLQLFAYTHPDEAAADVADWLAISPCALDRATDHARGEGRGR
ncbi:hypothetical protein EV652_103663 [Kribbella steppae]|uniref:Uncharacterized protein n=1 Tax=Kribbella steppae TaxID=2512223 RepID=A0A4R2HQY3_9ACTN|nr:hypothetical protein EV652_103663 [Kribbella steppae]